MPRCAIVDDRLVGFRTMPADPFVWAWLDISDSDEVQELLDNPERMDHIVVGPVGEFSEDLAVSVVAVSEEVVQLFDKYGFPLSAIPPELIVYDSAVSWGKSQRRSFRFLGNDNLFWVQKNFVLMVDAWLELHASTGSTVHADNEELHLMRTLTMEFMSSHAKHILEHLGWDEQRQFLVRQLFTPGWMLRGMADAAFEARDALFDQAGYRNLW